MSAAVVLIPVLSGVGWSVLSAAVAGVTNSLGFSLLGEGVKAAANLGTQAKGAGTELAGESASAEHELESTNLAQEDVAKLKQLTMCQGDIRLHIRQREDGTCTVCAEGKGKSKAQLKALAKQVGERLVQQMVYHRVTTELAGRGFQVLTQQVEEDGRIRIRVVRWV